MPERNELQFGNYPYEEDIVRRWVWNRSGWLPEVVTVLALTPFVAAISTSLGNAVGEFGRKELISILEKIPSRFRRENRSLPSSDEPAKIVVSVEQGSRIEISSETPIEAYALLTRIDFSALSDLGGSVPPTILWENGTWVAYTFNARREELIRARWNPEVRRWDRER